MERSRSRGHMAPKGKSQTQTGNPTNSGVRKSHKNNAKAGMNKVSKL